MAASHREVTWIESEPPRSSGWVRRRHARIQQGCAPTRYREVVLTFRSPVLGGEGGEVGGDHLFVQIAEAVGRFPAERLARFRGIADQQINFRRPVISLVDFHILTIIEIHFSKRDFTQLTHAVSFSSRDHKVVSFRLLKHYVHRSYVIFRVAPITLRFKISDPEF